MFGSEKIWGKENREKKMERKKKWNIFFKIYIYIYIFKINKLFYVLF